MHLRSTCSQTVAINGESFEFDEDETICTEYSHKYTIAGFEQIAAAAGLALRRHWTDSRGHFAVAHCVVLKPPKS